jgi:hypothetical protein
MFLILRLRHHLFLKAVFRAKAKSKAVWWGAGTAKEEHVKPMNAVKSWIDVEQHLEGVSQVSKGSRAGVKRFEIDGQKLPGS